MNKRRWSDKYPPEQEAFAEKGPLDAYVAATQAQDSVSAHAWQIYRRDDTENELVPIQSKSSENRSTQERGCLSAVVRILQRSSSHSDVRIFCRLENAVEGLKGVRNLITNSDILAEVEKLKAEKEINLEAVHSTKADKTRSRILERLLSEARNTRDVRLQELAQRKRA